VAKLTLDSEQTRVRVRTFAEGLFAKLAHDLELECRGITGSAEQTADRKGTASLEVPIGRIEVSGTLKDGRLDPRGLSAEGRQDCLGKMRADVFHLGARADGVVRVEALLDGAKARVRVVLPNGRSVERSIDVRFEATAGTLRASGALQLSLNALGSATVKGPMNAFRVKDTVEVLFEAVFQPES
jgi:hypothetical protein